MPWDWITQTQGFENCVRNFHASICRILPDGFRGEAKSLLAFGTQQPARGFTRRPELPHQQDTMLLLQEGFPTGTIRLLQGVVPPFSMCPCPKMKSQKFRESVTPSSNGSGIGIMVGSGGDNAFCNNHCRLEFISLVQLHFAPCLRLCPP